MTIIEGTVILVLPEFGAAGVCDTYDADCLCMSRSQRVNCFTDQEIPQIVGLCPFMD